MLQLFPHRLDDEGKLRISILPSTSQTQGDDCGVLAAAYATELVASDGVAGLQAPFEVPAMRPHLERCLEEGVMVSFPKMTKGVRGRRRRVLRVAVDASGVMVLNE